jgi:gliding motility-associated-like protein
VGNDTLIGTNQPLQLNALDLNNSGFDQWLWTPFTGLSDPYIPDPVALLTDNITYTLTATAPGGCSATGTISVKLYAGPSIYVPNAFTPNGDGHNDLLKAIPVGILEFKYFVIFNRWGQQVFYSNDPGKGWDGTLNGIPQDPGGFVWMTAGIDFKGNLIQKKGTVLLMR